MYLFTVTVYNEFTLKKKKQKQICITTNPGYRNEISSRRF